MKPHSSPGFTQKDMLGDVSILNPGTRRAPPSTRHNRAELSQMQVGGPGEGSTVPGPWGVLAAGQVAVMRGPRSRPQVQAPGWISRQGGASSPSINP